jgi:flagellar hook-associated protein 1 FlgK
MIDFLDRQLQSGSEDTLSSLYERFVGDVTQSATVARSASDGAVVFEESLRGQWLGIAGVSLDEEAVRMIQYQRAYQAAARYIGVLSELMGLLVNL